MDILSFKATVKEPVAEGNYDLPLTKIEQTKNQQGGYVQLTFKDNSTEIVHTIFGSNKKQIEYTIQTLGRQLGKFGDAVTLKDVLVLNHIYHIYVSYNDYGRNVSFGVRNTTETEEAPELTTEAPF